ARRAQRELLRLEGRKGVVDDDDGKCHAGRIGAGTTAILLGPGERGRQDRAPAITYTLSGERAMTAPKRMQSWIGALPYALIFSGAALRVIPHPPNFAPIGALALFGGAALPGVWAFAVPLAALVLSDAVLGFY